MKRNIYNLTDETLENILDIMEYHSDYYRTIYTEHNRKAVKDDIIKYLLTGKLPEEI